MFRVWYLHSTAHAGDKYARTHARRTHIHARAHAHATHAHTRMHVHPQVAQCLHADPRRRRQGARDRSARTHARARARTPAYTRSHARACTRSPAHTRSLPLPTLEASKPVSPWRRSPPRCCASPEPVTGGEGGTHSESDAELGGRSHGLGRCTECRHLTRSEGPRREGRLGYSRHQTQIHSRA